MKLNSIGNFPCHHFNQSIYISFLIFLFRWNQIWRNCNNIPVFYLKNSGVYFQMKRKNPFMSESEPSSIRMVSKKYSLLIGRWSKLFLKTILSDFHQLCQKMTHFNTTHVWLKKVSENANQIMFSKIMFNSQATPTNLKKNSKKLWRQIFKFIDIFAKILLKSHLKINPRMVSAATLTSMKLDWMHLFNQQYVKISAGVKELEKWLFMLPMLVFIHKEMACSEILSSFWINKTICL